VSFDGHIDVLRTNYCVFVLSVCRNQFVMPIGYSGIFSD
jgi:hypothetical protein